MMNSRTSNETVTDSGIHNCSRCAVRMREGRHNFTAKVGDKIIVIKDVPALICDSCSEIEYTLEVSKEIDAIMKEFFAERLLARPLAAGDVVFGRQRASSIDRASN